MAARAPHAAFAFCQAGKFASISDRLKKPLVTLGPWQPSCHRRPVAASIEAATRSVSFWVGTVPGTKYSLIVFVVNGPGLSPVNASTVAVWMSLGGLKFAIFSPLLTSRRIADQSGADVSSESLPSLGLLSLLPIQTPTEMAGAFGSAGGATKP